MPAPTAVELLWGTEQRPKRGPKPALSLAGIVGEAIALADAEGLANLSMQRLAERLGYTKMSLYRYLPGKAELMALMLDAGIGTPPDLTALSANSSDERWRCGLREWAETIFARYSAHPWTLELATGVRPFGPNEMAWLETALEVLADCGLSGPERLDAIVLLNGHVRSLSHQTVGKQGVEDALIQQLGAVMTAAVDRYPQSVAAFAEQADHSRTDSESGAGRDNALNFGLDRILDGLQVLITSRR